MTEQEMKSHIENLSTPELKKEEILRLTNYLKDQLVKINEEINSVK